MYILDLTTASFLRCRRFRAVLSYLSAKEPNCRLYLFFILLLTRNHHHHVDKCQRQSQAFAASTQRLLRFRKPNSTRR